MSILDVVPVGAIAADEGTQWLIEGLWTEEAVGIVSGQPKLGKTWLALDLALSVSGVLAYLRQLQREEHVAILVVHHARKAGAESSQAGLSLRGSGDFYAWGDAYLYLRRRRANLEMIVEHRNAPRPDPVELVLRVDGAPHLEVVASTSASTDEAPVDPIKGKVLEVLASASEPMTQEALRAELRVRLQRVVGALRDLERENQIHRLASGWAVAKNGTGS